MTTNNTDPGPITEEAQRSFDVLREMFVASYLTDLADEQRGIALMSVLFDGKPTAVVVWISEEEDDPGIMRVDPMAILVDQALMARLDPASEDVEQVSREP